MRGQHALFNVNQEYVCAVAPLLEHIDALTARLAEAERVTEEQVLRHAQSVGAGRKARCIPHRRAWRWVMVGGTVVETIIVPAQIENDVDELRFGMELEARDVRDRGDECAVFVADSPAARSISEGDIGKAAYSGRRSPAPLLTSHCRSVALVARAMSFQISASRGSSYSCYIAGR
jgi:hypothetical protein